MELARRFLFMLALTVIVLGGVAVVHYARLTRAPLELGGLVSALVIVLAYALAAAALAAILRKPTLAVMLIFVAALLPLSAAPEYALGFAVAALCISGYLLERNHPRSAALVLALTMLEPQIAIAAIVAMFVLVPRSRVTLAIAVIALKLLGLAVFGVARELAYYAPALPATSAGWAWYAGAALVGIIVAARAARVVDQPPLRILLPVAAAVLGSPDLASAHVAAALPAAIVLAPNSWTARIAIALLVVRWDGALRPETIPAILGGAGTAFVAFARDEVRERVGWLVFAPLLSLAALALLARLEIRAQIEIASLWLGILLLFYVRAPRTNPFRLSRLD